MKMVSGFFDDIAEVKARQTSTMISIILASPCGDHKTMQSSSAFIAYPIPHDERSPSPAPVTSTSVGSSGALLAQRG